MGMRKLRGRKTPVSQNHFGIGDTPKIRFLILYQCVTLFPRQNCRTAVIAGHIFPSDFAIYGLIRLNQMGATLLEVGLDWAGLWIMTTIYFLFAVLSARAFKRREASG